MKKLLYISVNSKPEDLSASKTVARKFINKFLQKNKDFQVEEIDLYKEHIPRLEYQYFEKRNCIVNEDDAKKLNDKDQKEVQRIRALCDQFISANVYVIAAPMWSLSFPAPLKEYIDCIMQDQKTIKFEGKKIEPLLNDKPRTMVYIQSSGGNVPWMLRPILNKGLNYVEDIIKFMGIKKFEELLVDDTGFTEEEKQEYLTIININSRRATKIITDLFEFSLLDSMDYKLNMKNVDVNEVLREIVAYYIPELEAKDFNYDFNISEEEYLVNIDEVKFTRAISNLIDNAIKYNEKNTTLSVISRKFNDRIEIRIFDDGRGINEEIRELIRELNK